MSWYRIEQTSPGVVLIDLYGPIDSFDATAQMFRAELQAIENVAEIQMHISSPGGDVYEALAVLNTLRQHPARVVTTIDSVAASAAGFIAVGASDSLLMAPNSELMAHLPMGGAAGNAAEMRRTAERLDAIATNIASIFADRAGGTVADWLDVLAAETWWSAQEAVDAGIADGIASDARVLQPTNSFDLSLCAYAGRAAAPPPRNVAAERPQPTEAEAVNERGSRMATLQESLAGLLGIDAEADEDAIMAAARERLNVQPVEVTVEPTLEVVTAVAAKAGLTMVNSDALASLWEQARAGAEAREQQVRERHEAVVNQAITEGRIPPARRDHWLNQLSIDPEGITGVINSLPAVIPLEPLGHSVTHELPSSEDEQLYELIYGKKV